MRWQIVLAVVALAAAGALVWVRIARERAWLEEMLATGCSPLVPIGDIVVLAWVAAALVLLAGIVLLRVGWRGLRERVGAWTIAELVVGIVVLLAALGLGLDAVLMPTDPLHGLDGSGLPCGGG